ncbi:hypothetical protein WG915_04660 [Corynebacterium sp. H128]|uniref:hypothetical protein n=1 Tax=unclassified Corynebacterium TaxID=2624378 RepID=UPI0030A7CBCB
MTSLSRRALATFALTTGIAAAPAVAHADQVDQALAALPAGQISCEQATKYWTNEADYNDKVAKAQMLAMVDSRGPQIQDALGRIDEAANRCGLKGGGAPAPAPAPAPEAPAPAPADNGGAPAPQAPAPAPAPADNGGAPAPAPAQAAPAGAINLAAPGMPSYNVQLPGGQWVTLPNLQQIVADFLAKYGIHI